MAGFTNDGFSLVILLKTNKTKQQQYRANQNEDNIEQNKIRTTYSKPKKIKKIEQNKDNIEQIKTRII